MNSSILRIAVAVFSAMLFSAGHMLGGQDGIKEYSIVVTKPVAEYTVDTNGTMDPENVEIVIENLGDRPAVSPRMTVNGLYDWYDVNSMLKEIIRGTETDEEKAMAIWAWILHKRFQREPHDDSSIHPVRDLNGYGYGICGHSAAWMSCFCRAAGIRARVWEVTGHTEAEVYFNGAWHVLDANTAQTFYLDRDNRTIASMATLEKA